MSGIFAKRDSITLKCKLETKQGVVSICTYVKIWYAKYFVTVSVIYRFISFVNKRNKCICLFKKVNWIILYNIDQIIHSCKSWYDIIQVIHISFILACHNIEHLWRAVKKRIDIYLHLCLWAFLQMYCFTRDSFVW